MVAEGRPGCGIGKDKRVFSSAPYALSDIGRMRIIITGALGHIGSRLIRELPRAFPEAQLVLIDDLSAQRYCSLFDLPMGNYSFHEADILKADLAQIFAGAQVVVHLAAITDAANSFNI